jgi:thiol-disulfide isomerase/thioredoxin
MRDEQKNAWNRAPALGRMLALPGHSLIPYRREAVFPLIVLAAVMVFSVLFTMAARAGLPHGLHSPEPVAAPVLELDDLAGKRHLLADYRGEVLVISFWATWCVPCRKELPGMARAARELAVDGVRIVTVAMGQDATEVREFIERFDFDLPKLVDPDGTASERWQVRSLPTSVVVDPAGRQVLLVIGAYDWEAPELWDRLRALARTERT